MYNFIKLNEENKEKLNLKKGGIYLIKLKSSLKPLKGYGKYCTFEYSKMYNEIGNLNCEEGGIDYNPSTYNDIISYFLYDEENYEIIPVYEWP